MAGRPEEEVKAEDVDVLVFLAGVGDVGGGGGCGGGGVEGAWDNLTRGRIQRHKGGVYVWNVLQLRDGVGRIHGIGRLIMGHQRCTQGFTFDLRR